MRISLIREHDRRVSPGRISTAVAATPGADALIVAVGRRARMCRPGMRLGAAMRCPA